MEKFYNYYDASGRSPFSTQQRGNTDYFRWSKSILVAAAACVWAVRGKCKITLQSRSRCESVLKW